MINPGKFIIQDKGTYKGCTIKNNGWSITVKFYIKL